MSDVVERGEEAIRAHTWAKACGVQVSSDHMAKILDDAIAEVKRLRAQIARMRECR